MTASLPQLPPGRHGLSRKTVEAHQWGRILTATKTCAETLGWPRMSVEAVVRIAGVSRRTFYDYFVDLEDAFVTAHREGLLRTRAKASTLTPYLGPELAWEVVKASSGMGQGRS